MSDVKLYTTKEGLSLAYTDEGDGLPVIALPGLTRTGRDFDFVAPHLSGVRLIRPDYRGRGRSDFAGWETYTVPQEAGDVLALMEHLGLSRAAFLGTSRGGLISMAIAAGQPDKVIGVCLNDIGPDIDRAGLEVIAKYIGVPPSAASYDEVTPVRAKTAAGFANVPMSRWREDVERLFDETPDGLTLNYDPLLAKSFEVALNAPDPDLWPLFHALAGKPLALIHGLNSDLLTHATVEKMKAARPDMIYAGVPDRGHIPWLDEPEALSAITQWIDACR